MHVTDAWTGRTPILGAVLARKCQVRGVLSGLGAGRTRRYRNDVQRIFTMFPDGGPGIALIMLRGCIVASLLDPIVSGARGGIDSSVLIAAPLIVAVLIAVGLFTPLAASAALVVTGLRLPHTAGDISVSMVIAVLVALSVLLLGPGAYSIDARLFGRRIVLPPDETL
jgi:hypothetical protein